MKRAFAIVMLLLASSLFRAAAQTLFLETENFTTPGGWALDQQFMDEMGSPYLLAHGFGTPVEDAVTTVDIPSPGVWNVWVRTYNWTSPWYEGEGPGKFKVKIAGKLLKGVVGAQGSGWQWQKAGSAKLKQGKVSLALHDLTGFDGRCDAVVLTKSEDTGFVRPVKSVSGKAKYDMVVVGGGIAGMCAAVAAARQGLQVALVNDRPVLGGNNSSEVRVHLGGTIELGTYPALGRMLREFGHSRNGNAQPAENYEDAKKQAFIDAESGVTLYAPYRAVEVLKSAPDMICGVEIRHIATGEGLVLEAPLFCDATGDGTVGFKAGAHYRMGREAREEYSESLAPEVADKYVMGASVQWYSKEYPRKVKFPVFEYGLNFNSESVQKVSMGEWTWETGMMHDMTTEFERIRDYGLAVVYSNWSWLKNHEGMFQDRNLDWVAYIAGKRESRRLLGDYVFSQQDIESGFEHEDATFAVSWSVDLHFPDPENTKYFPGEEFLSATIHHKIYAATVPYRCLYSRNIRNLFMAGRDISETHVALGTTRVMRTLAMSGEVVGLAASICKQNGVLPREVYWNYLEDLKALMKKGAAVEGLLPDNQHFNYQDNYDTPRPIE